MLPNILVQGPFFMIWGVKQFQVGTQPDGNRVFGRIFSLYMAVQAFVWLGVCVVAPDLIRGVTGSAYHGASDYVPWIVGAYVFSGVYSFVQYGLLSRKSTGILAVLVLSGAAVNIGLNLWLIPRWGATGASISTLASFAYLAAVTALVSLRIYPIEFEWSRLAVVAAGAAVYCLVGLMIPSSIGVVSATAARLVWLSTFPIFLLFSNFVDSSERKAVLARIRGLIGAARGVPRT
jgi:O-antigen/teichoic acid export membrane protein